jgi:hypothetical protein
MYASVAKSVPVACIALWRSSRIVLASTDTPPPNCEQTPVTLEVAPPVNARLQTFVKPDKV